MYYSPLREEKPGNGISPSSISSQMKKLSVLVAVSLLTVSLVGCSSSDQEKAREDARKTAAEVKSDAHDLAGKVDNALKPDGRSASEKLETARVKLDQATLLAKVKTKLAADVGASTLTNVTVNANGSIVTLNGSVSSADQKSAATRSASQVEGVTQVQNNLTIQP